MHSEKAMKITLRTTLKAITFGILLAISIFGPLREAIIEYRDPGSKTRKSTEFVSAYKSPAFTFCFTPPFNSSSNVHSDFFLGQGPKNEEDQWQLFASLKLQDEIYTSPSARFASRGSPISL